MKKQELLKYLKEAVMTEERIIPIYEKHLKSAIFWIKIDKDKAEKARGMMDKMIQDSRKHWQITKSLMDQVSKEDRDAF
ncbi:MAG: hypothetical protein ABIH85_01705 [Candidatus Omnitrophota bacterium]|nr:hypothetical protein [Candidatus Omnitrophota bacterium]